MRLVLLLTLLAPATTALARDCSSAEAAARAARLTLDECGTVAPGSCAEEEQALGDAQAALERCQAGEPEIPPVQLRPAFAGTVALVIDAASEEEALAVQAGAQLALSGMSVIDNGVVRAAQAFLTTDTTTDSSEALRAAVRADELLLIGVKAEGDARYLSFRIVGKRAQTRFAESKASALGITSKDVVSELYPKIEIVATPTPRPFAWATPTPTPPPGPPPPRMQVHLSALAASKSLTAKDWAPLARQNEIGLLSTFGRESWPVHIAGDITYSTASGTAEGIPIRSTTMEGAAGIRRSFNVPLVRPDVGGGIVLTRVENAAEFPDKEQRRSGTGLGFWIGAGGSVGLTRSITAGFHLRFSSARASLGSRSLDTGGVHAGVTAGVRL